MIDMNYTQNGVLQKIIATHLVEILAKKPCDSSSILDIGCGTGFIAQKLIEKGFASEKILQIDANKRSLSIAQQFAETKQVNFNTPLKFEQKFDVITSSMSLQWAENLGETIANIKSLLSVNGVFIASIPLNGSLANVYETLGISTFHFPKIEEIATHLSLVKSKIFSENAFVGLKNLHLCNLKLSDQKQSINSEKIRILKTTLTRWNIGFFIYTN